MFKLSSKLNYFQVSKDCAAPEGRVEPSRHREGELAMTNVILSEVPPSGPEINHSPLALQSSTTIQHCPGGSWSWKCLGPSSCWDLCLHWEMTSPVTHALVQAPAPYQPTITATAPLH